MASERCQKKEKDQAGAKIRCAAANVRTILDKHEALECAGLAETAFRSDLGLHCTKQKRSAHWDGMDNLQVPATD